MLVGRAIGASCCGVVLVCWYFCFAVCRLVLCGCGALCCVCCVRWVYVLVARGVCYVLLCGVVMYWCGVGVVLVCVVYVWMCGVGVQV